MCPQKREKGFHSKNRLVLCDRTFFSFSSIIPLKHRRILFLCTVYEFSWRQWTLIYSRYRLNTQNTKAATTKRTQQLHNHHFLLSPPVEQKNEIHFSGWIRFVYTLLYCFLLCMGMMLTWLLMSLSIDRKKKTRKIHTHTHKATRQKQQPDRGNLYVLHICIVHCIGYTKL